MTQDEVEGAQPTRPPGVSEHAILQAEARLGVALSWAAWVDVVGQILDRRALLVRSRTHPIKGLMEHWLARSPHGYVRAVWAADDALIVTVLPSKKSRSRGIAGSIGGGYQGGRREERRPTDRRQWLTEAGE